MEPRLSVAQFNGLIEQSLQAIGELIVEGEITQYNITAKGGVNIVLKDPKESAVLNLSGYAPNVEGVRMVKVGMKVAAWGVPSLWSMGGRFSLKIFKILPQGEGALKEAYEKLKLQLSAEGLFAEERKRPLPDFITRIALVTGRDSAAQSDFLKILHEHHTGIEVDYYPVQVQGKFAEAEIINTLKYADAQSYDCLVLVRGGGSLEDLITFNSEKLARVIFAMKTMVVVGIGHEKDESIADYVADIRASTPSQAAYYLAVNNENFIDKQEMKLDFISGSLKQNFDSWKYAISSRAQGISSVILVSIQRLHNRIQTVSGGLADHLILSVREYQSRVQDLQYLTARVPKIFQERQQYLQTMERLLGSYNPHNVLKRGFSIVRTKQGKVVNSIAHVSQGENLGITLSDGDLLTNILQIKPNHEHKER